MDNSFVVHFDPTRKVNLQALMQNAYDAMMESRVPANIDIQEKENPNIYKRKGFDESCSCHNNSTIGV